MDRFQFRRDTSARWTEINPILLEGEIGVETDTKLRKMGDGTNTWNNLDYLAAENIVQELGDSETATVSQKVTTSILRDLDESTNVVWWDKAVDLPFSGYISKNNGALYPLSGIRCTDFIHIPVGVPVQTIEAFLQDKAGIAIYNSAKTFVRSLSSLDDTNGNGNVVLSLNDGEKYIRVSFASSKNRVGVRYMKVDNNAFLNKKVDVINSILEMPITADNTSIGYVNTLGNIISSVNFSRCTGKVPISPNSTIVVTKPFIQDSAATCTFDENNQLVRSFNMSNTETNPDYLEFTSLENEVYLRSSFLISSLPTSILRNINHLVDNSTSLGAVYRNNIPFTRGAYIGLSGEPISLSSFGYTDYISLPKNILFSAPNWLIDNASAAFYDKDKKMTRILKSSDFTGKSDIVFSMQEGEEYFRTSIRLSKVTGDTVSFYFAQEVTKADIMNLISVTPITNNNPTYFSNVISAFDNLICIGDSLTYSQVYVSSSSSRQAKVPYPKALSRISGATSTILARSGATAKSCWDEFGSQITQQNNSLAIIYLGTNAGITDTLSTDVVGDNPDLWADNNIGCYCRFVQKLQSLGTKVLLLRIWATSGSGASSLTNTNNAITHIAERFNCAVIDVPVNRELQYHYYPNLSGSNGVHYNDLGYSWFASNLMQKIGELDTNQMKLLIPN